MTLSKPFNALVADVPLVVLHYDTSPQVSSVPLFSAISLISLLKHCCLIGPGRSSDDEEEDEVELYHLADMVEQTH